MEAATAEHALTEARETVKEEPASLEVWDETGLLIQRKGASIPHFDADS